MIKGIGIDIVEIERIEKIAMRQPRFVERILTVAERNIYETLSKRRQLEFLAGRFATKEAVAKAVGTGITHSISWQDIEVLNDERGKPIVNAPIDSTIHLSISHSKEYAVAQVIIES